jgi:hypothetical protein
MIDDKPGQPAAARKTLKLGPRKAAVEKPAEETSIAPIVASTSITRPMHHTSKSGRVAGPTDWAAAHKRRMQDDMDALMSARGD